MEKAAAAVVPSALGDLEKKDLVAECVMREPSECLVASSSPERTLAQRQQVVVPRIVEPAAELLCPICHQTLDDPVMTCDGQTYDRKCIARWFLDRKTNKSPLTGAPLPSIGVVPNILARQMADLWFRTQKVATFAEFVALLREQPTYDAVKNDPALSHRMASALHKKLETVQVLSEYATRVDARGVYAIAHYANCSVLDTPIPLDYLMALGSDVDCQSGPVGWTVAIILSARGAHNMLRHWVTAYKPNLELRSSIGYSALDYASTAPVIEALISAKADVNATGPTGWTTLHRRAQTPMNEWKSSPSFDETLKKLLDCKADCNAQTPRTRHTPLMFARTPRMVQYLVHYGASLDAVDAVEGRTPLMHAIARGADTDQVALTLLSMRGALSTRDRQGKSALDLAMDHARPAVVQLILTYAQTKNHILADALLVDAEPADGPAPPRKPLQIQDATFLKQQPAALADQRQ